MGISVLDDYEKEKNMNKYTWRNELDQQIVILRFKF